MKKIIKGKLYNTETAESIAVWSNGHFPSDFRHCEESLYKTKKGAWFIAGSGGAMSKYGRSYGNSTGGGEGIQPLTAEEAKAWLEEKDFTAELEEHFSDQIEEA